VVISTDYFDKVINYRAEVVQRAMRILRRHAAEYDVITCRGYSGMVIAPILAYELGKPIFFVRKSDESSHARREAAGELGGQYCFVDDFIGTGLTLERVVQVLSDVHKAHGFPPPILAGIYLYYPIGDRRYEESFNGYPIWSVGEED